MLIKNFFYISKEDSYYRWTTFMHAFTVFSEPLLFFAILYFNFHIRISEIIQNFTTSPVLIFTLMFLAFSLIHSAFYLPISFIRSYVIERGFDKCTQSLAGWIKDAMLAAVLKGTLLFIILSIIYYLLAVIPHYWWLFSYVLTQGFYLLISFIAPVLFFPMFFKFTPLPESDLRERLLNFVKKIDSALKIKNLYEVDLSKKTNSANAAFMGIGKTRRVAFSDTLLNQFTNDEVEAILAHELGHYKLNHLITGNLATAAFLFIFFYTTHLTAGALAGFFSVKEISSPVSMPLIGMILSVEGIIILPFFNAMIRRFEYQADKFSAENSTNPGALITSLERLAGINLVKKEPGRVVEFLFHSHPSIQKRIDYLKTLIHAEPIIQSEYPESKIENDYKQE